MDERRGGVPLDGEDAGRPNSWGRQRGALGGQRTLRLHALVGALLQAADYARAAWGPFPLEGREGGSRELREGVLRLRQRRVRMLKPEAI